MLLMHKSKNRKILETADKHVRMLEKKVCAIWSLMFGVLKAIKYSSCGYHFQLEPS